MGRNDRGIVFFGASRRSSSSNPGIFGKHTTTPSIRVQLHATGSMGLFHSVLFSTVFRPIFESRYENFYKVKITMYYSFSLFLSFVSCIGFGKIPRATRLFSLVQFYLARYVTRSVDNFTDGDFTFFTCAVGVFEIIWRNIQNVPCDLTVIN